jgi:outer membrane protein assembly factor BamB
LYLASVASEAPHLLVTGFAERDGAVVSNARFDAGLPILTIAFSNGRIFGTGDTAGERVPGLGAFALDPATGTLDWSHDFQLEAVAPQAAITIELRSSELLARDPASGGVIWSANSAAAAAAIAGDVLYEAGYLFNGSTSQNGLIMRSVSDGSVIAFVASLPNDFTLNVIPSNGRVYEVESSHLVALAPS